MLININLLKIKADHSLDVRSQEKSSITHFWFWFFELVLEVLDSFELFKFQTSQFLVMRLS